MRFRNYIVQMADRTAFYVTEKDGISAMKAFAQGQAVIVRGRCVAHHMISVIRPCNAIEAQEADETIRNEDRAKLFRDGVLKLEESTQNEQRTFKIISTPPQIHSPM